MRARLSRRDCSSHRVCRAASRCIPRACPGVCFHPVPRSHDFHRPLEEVFPRRFGPERRPGQYDPDGLQGGLERGASIPGNRKLGITLPPSPFLQIPAQPTSSIGASAELVSGSSTNDLLLRWDATAVSTSRFVGRNELIEQHVGVETYTKGRYFFLPDTNIDTGQPRGLPAGPVRDRRRQRPCGAHEHVPACQR